MSKELENLLEDFKIIKFKTINAGYDYGYEVWDKAEQALLELKEMKEAKPSKALEELNEIIEYITEDKKVKYKATILFDCEIIKDALLKAEENTKLLGYLKNNLSLIPMETGEDEIGIGCPINGDTIGPNDEGYEAIKKWLSNKDKSK